MEPPQRISGESPDAYRHFVRWLRHIGPERISESTSVARDMGITRSKLATMKSRNQWVQRRKESGWDAHAITEATSALVDTSTDTTDSEPTDDNDDSGTQALSGDLIPAPKPTPPPEPAAPVATEGPVTTRDAIAWREHILAGVGDMAAAARMAGRVTRAYFDAVDRARRHSGYLTGGEQPEPRDADKIDWPDTGLRDAAMVALKSFWSPSINEQVAVEHAAAPEVQRADDLNLTHPERARDAYAALAERIGAAGDITDPRHRGTGR